MRLRKKKCLYEQYKQNYFGSFKPKVPLECISLPRHLNIFPLINMHTNICIMVRDFLIENSLFVNEHNIDLFTPMDFLQD